MKKQLLTTIFVFSLALFATPLASFCVALDKTDTVTVTKQYTSENKEEKYSFEEEMEKNGKNYKLDDTEYKIINSEPIYETVTKTETDTVDGLDTDSYTISFPGDLPTTKELTYDGKTYTAVLTEISYESTTGESRTTQLSSTLDLPKGNIPQTVKYNYYDSLTDQTITYEIPKISETESTKTQNITENFRVTFYQYDRGAVVINGKVIAIHDTGSPVDSEFYPEIKAVSDFADRQGNITALVWDGEPYTQNGEVCRNATATLSGEENLVAVTYGGTVELPSTEAYKANLTYSAEVKEDTGKRLYSLQATASYKIVETEISVAEPETESNPLDTLSLAGIGIFVFAFAVIIILVIIAQIGKQKNKKI